MLFFANEYNSYWCIFILINNWSNKIILNQCCVSFTYTELRYKQQGNIRNWGANNKLNDDVWNWFLYLYHLYHHFSGLSLVLNKEGCDWQRQTLNLSDLKGEWPVKPDLIHTSCRSESSNISLVVLDKY